MYERQNSMKASVNVGRTELIGEYTIVRFNLQTFKAESLSYSF